tara:strand:+ start:4080 stop:4712 length:633 start_codon:yes stop_codon:yes gene_type:complete
VDSVLIDLTKHFVPGQLKYLGQRMLRWGPEAIPVAARSAEDLEDHYGGHCHRLGRIHLRNVIVVEVDPIRLIYVRPLFRRYRSAALRLFSPTTTEIAIDHVLGRTMAHAWGYDYVLLQRINPTTNAAHGRFETTPDPLAFYPRLCFWDPRLKNKPLHRGPSHWGVEPLVYDPNVRFDVGLALNQLGRLGWALGVEDAFEPHLGLTPVTFG